MASACLICLESVDPTNYKNPIRCSCKLVGHPRCFQRWFRSKGHMECPICHTVSYPNLYRQPIINVVYVNTTYVQYELSRRRRFFIGFFVSFFLLSCVSLMIFFIVINKRK
jgi:hypothetical protein